ncbi:MAG: lysine 2,3-aminomutase, partial [Odoribacter sp.]|nr:lysine 2,3-aminomutase [Odoribacter sp.]
MNAKNKSVFRPINASDQNWQDWRWQLKNRITRPEILANLLHEPAAKLEELKQAASVYRLAITPYYFSLINHNDENDPIKRQCFPDPQEILPTCSS